MQTNTIQKPLTDEQIWGQPEGQQTEQICPLKEDGRCPAGCNECVKFNMETEGLLKKKRIT